MKCERILRQYKTVISETCKQLQIPEPAKVEHMPNYFGRPEKNFSAVNRINPDEYVLRLRTHQYTETLDLEKRRQEDVIETIRRTLEQMKN